MEREDIRSRLDDVRRRRAEARRLDAELAREEATLVSRLGRQLDGDSPAEVAAVHEAMDEHLDRSYGALRSVEDLPDVIHAWRRRIPGDLRLWHQIDRDRDHIRGDPAAPVVVVEYGDYGCPECAEANGFYPLIRAWLDEGRLCAVFRHFPLIDAHPFALRAAQAAEAAGRQDRFWQLHDLLLRYEVTTDDDHQEHIRLTTPRTSEGLERLAHRAGVDIERFRHDIEDPALIERILSDFRGGLASGVNGTPTFYVNGERTDLSGIDDLYGKIAALVR